MNEPTLIQTKTALAIDSITVTSRLRPVSEAGVNSLLVSIGAVGQIIAPLTIRQRRNDGEIVYELIDGAHRLEAARRSGMQMVPVRVLECTNDHARLLEIDGNLAGAELNPLDTAVFLATRKTVYERLHPETKRGVAGALHKNSATDIESVASFVSVTAEKFGMTERHVRRLVVAGSRLGSDEISRLRSAPRQVTLKDLQDIAKIQQAADRNDVVYALAEGRAKNAAAAVRALKSGPETPVKDPVQDQFLALKTAWKRAGAVARRRFIAEFFDDLSEPVCLEAADRDEAEVAMLRASLPGVAAE